MVASVHAKGQQSYSSQSMGDAPELETSGRVSVAVARRRCVRASRLRAVWAGLVQIMIFLPRARKAARTAMATQPCGPADLTEPWSAARPLRIFAEIRDVLLGSLL
jgi:hypothetical protein